jgi:hypothetical protein
MGQETMDLKKRGKPQRTTTGSGQKTENRIRVFLWQKPIPREKFS